MREPFGRNAVKLFKKAKTENWILYTSAISIKTTHYIASKSEGMERSKSIIASLLHIIEIIPADRFALISSLSSKIIDYEDAIQFSCALKINGVNGIITRDLKDFKYSTIPVFAPEEVLY
jgi:hypothetical protein